LLKTRILTAVILAPAGIALLFLAPAWGFNLTVALLMLIGTWEFHLLAGLRLAPCLILLALQTFLMAMIFLYWPVVTAHAFTLLLAGCFLWCLMFLRVTRYRADQLPDFSYQLASFLSALASITICTFSLALLRDQAHGQFLILLLLIIIWAADIGAYFSGKFFGRTKLASVISPNKTWEGAIGGVILAGLAALLLSHYIPSLEADAGLLSILVAVTVLTSVGGDLFISMHKRTMKMKDSGKIFPGHGGVLDRFDSLLAGVPFFALGLWIFDS
jgi:phosphatidate cytidylyltransferase